MKLKTISLLTFFSLLLIQSCIPIIGDDADNKGGTTFLVLHQNSDNQLGEGSYLSLLTIEKGEAQYKQLHSIYPARDMYTNVDINNKRVAIGLHANFNTEGRARLTTGAWFDIEGSDWEQLPILPASDEYRYSYLDVVTTKVSKSGHIFYLSSSNDRMYHDQYRASLVRYDPKTKELKQAISPGGFAVSQPEKGWDTETALHGTLFYPSDDGRYVYGFARAFGVDGGVLHWDYEILYRYDFDTDTYTRIGSADDRRVTVIGITSDRQHLAYTTSVSGNHYRNLVNTSSNNVIQTTLTGGQAFNNTSRWNSSGYCAAATNNTIGVYNMSGGTNHNISTQARPYFAQYDKNGSQIYFMIDTSNGKYLCKTSDNTAEATIDTVCVLQSNVREFMVVK